MNTPLGQCRLLVVDDEEAIQRSLARMLARAGYPCSTASSAEEALAVLRGEPHDLVLSDVNMPDRSGLWLLERVASDHPGTAVVMVTGVDDTDLAERCLTVGAYGYIVKPFERNEILVNVANALRRRSLELENEAHRRLLEELVAERTAGLRHALGQLEASDRALRHAYEETVQRLANAAEFRDPFTGVHLQRMSRYSALLSRLAGLDDQRCELIRLASPMHDIGKVAIPDGILGKPGVLTVEEVAIMRSHSRIGNEILAGSNSELLRLGGLIALTHHERYDGTGYPSGLGGTDIPLEGRIVAVSDVFDALTSERPYKPAFPIEQALAMIKDGRGSHFDPDLVDLFIDAGDDIALIAGATIV